MSRIDDIRALVRFARLRSDSKTGAFELLRDTLAYATGALRADAGDIDDAIAMLKATRDAAADQDLLA